MTNKRPPFNEFEHSILHESESYITGSMDGECGYLFNGDRYGDDHREYWNYRVGYEEDTTQRNQMQQKNAKAEAPTCRMVDISVIPCPEGRRRGAYSAAY